MVNVQMVMRVALLVGGIGSLVSAASPSAADEKEEAAITTERLTKLYATDPEQFDKKYALLKSF